MTVHKQVKDCSPTTRQRNKMAQAVNHKTQLFIGDYWIYMLTEITAIGCMSGNIALIGNYGLRRI